MYIASSRVSAWRAVPFSCGSHGGGANVPTAPVNKARSAESMRSSRRVIAKRVSMGPSLSAAHRTVNRAGVDSHGSSTCQSVTSQGSPPASHFSRAASSPAPSSAQARTNSPPLPGLPSRWIVSGPFFSEGQPAGFGGGRAGPTPWLTSAESSSGDTSRPRTTTTPRAAATAASVPGGATEKPGSCSKTAPQPSAACIGAAAASSASASGGAAYMGASAFTSSACGPRRSRFAWPRRQSADTTVGTRLRANARTAPSRRHASAHATATSGRWRPWVCTNSPANAHEAMLSAK